MSVLLKAQKLGVLDEKQIKSLLCPENQDEGQILFVQEGVTLKASASSDAQTFLGTVFVSTDVEKNLFILWLPYSYVFHLDPSLVSPATKQSLALDKVLPSSNNNNNNNNNTSATSAASGNNSSNNNSNSEGGEGSSTTLSVMRAEWLFTQVISFENVLRIRCKVTLRGKRVVTFHRQQSAANQTISSAQQQSAADFPFTFLDGGVDKLLALLRSVGSATIQPTPGGSPDDLVVTHSTSSKVKTGPSSSASAAASGGGDAVQQFRDSTYEKNSGGGSNKKVGARVWSNFVSAVSRGGKFLAEHFLDESERVPAYSDSDPRRLQHQGSGGTEGSGSEFDFMEPVQPIEEVKPKLRFPSKSKLPALGQKLTKNQWLACFDKSAGGAADPAKFAEARETIFKAGGCEDSIRGEVWKYLLGVYSPEQTAVARAAVDEENADLYDSIKRQWMSIGPQQESRFTAFRDRRTAVDKDVARTDRSHPLFRHDNSERLVWMRNILLTYSFFNFDLSYCQGMSDILSVLLVLYESEAEVFTVFRHLMEKVSGNFENAPEKHTMASQLRSIEVLVHEFIVPLYSHLQTQQATNMCFCFKMLLILFKREFGFAEIFRLWDTIFSCPFTDQYEIIIATTLLRAASEQIVDHCMQFDELLKYSNSICAGVTSIDELIQSSSEFYSFCEQQYEWSSKNNNTASSPATSASSSPATGGRDNKEGSKRPSVRDLVKAFEFK